ncbi:glycosyltransferase family 2 protein [Aeromonas veronii]|uniref:glycosyltransferase family 2 protein n=1 Tax=Aeromonas veronii TaxID=654 RepID=UPI003003E6DF
MIKTSVIIPYKNNVKALERAIISVLAQTVPVNIIIVDDGSDDGQRAERALNNLPDVDNIKVIYNKVSVGGGEARNIGIKHSHTKYIAFLDCDDYWDSNKIETQENQHESIALPKLVLFTSIKVVDEELNLVKEYKNNISITDFSDYVFLKGGLIQTSSLFLETKLASENFFNPNLKRHQDYDFCLKLQNEGAIFFGCNKTYSYWVISNDPLVALKKGYDFKISIDFYKSYKIMMAPFAGYAFLAKIPFWFCYKQKRSLEFFRELYKECGFKTTIMVVLQLAKMILSKWTNNNAKMELSS